MDLSILSLVVNSTNLEAERTGSDFRLEKKDILAFIAVQYCREVFCRGVAVRDLWSEMFGLGIIKRLLSKNKFVKIMKFLRFDDKRTRAERIKKDKFAMMGNLGKVY